MEMEDSEQAVSKFRLILPKKIFEVCYLIKREIEVEFIGTDISGEFTKQIFVSRPDDDHVCVSLSVDCLTYEESNLCLYVDKAYPKDSESLKNCVANVNEHVLTSLDTFPTSLRLHSNIENSKPVALTPSNNLDHDSGLVQKEVHVCYAPDGQTHKRKRGRPRKGTYTNRLGSELTVSIWNEDKPADSSLTVDDPIIAASGRKIRKPARFREIYIETDVAIEKQLDQDGALSGELGIKDSGGALPDAESHNNEKIAVVFEEREETVNENAIAIKEKPVGSADSIIIIKPRLVRPASQMIKRFKLSKSKKHTHPIVKKRPSYKREENIKCRICHNMYKDEQSLIAHVNKIHGNDPHASSYVSELKELSKVTCKICGKILGSKRNEMQSHMVRVHGKDDEFVSKCDECGMEFKRSFLLKEHKRRQHPKHERILCHMCPASFKLKEYLTEHIKYTHNKVYKWQCDICQKYTSSPKNLRRHKKLHDGAVHQCTICNKMFHEASNLRRHVLYVHNNQDVLRHQCVHCDKDFSTKNNLIQHVNMVHMKTSYYCDICKKFFECRKDLVQHAKVSHPGVPLLTTHPPDSREEGLSQLYNQDGAGNKSTILIQTLDGSQHLLLPKDLGQFTGEIITNFDGSLPSNLTNAINMALAEQSSLSNLSVSQQALATFEPTGNMDNPESGTGHFLSVINDDGQEIRVEIIRKPADDQHLESTYSQSAENSLHASEPDEQKGSV